MNSAEDGIKMYVYVKGVVWDGVDEIYLAYDRVL
jgi:hypothetical protein